MPLSVVSIAHTHAHTRLTPTNTHTLTHILLPHSPCQQFPFPFPFPFFSLLHTHGTNFTSLSHTHSLHLSRSHAHSLSLQPLPSFHSITLQPAYLSSSTESLTLNGGETYLSADQGDNDNKNTDDNDMKKIQKNKKDTIK